MAPSFKEMTLKEPGEKLVTVKTRIRDGSIAEIRLGGDFFIYPEDGIELIESALRGVEISYATLVEKISEAVQQNGLELVGISPETIAKGITMEESP